MGLRPWKDRAVADAPLEDVDVVDWFGDHGFALERVEGVQDTHRTRVIGRNATWDLFITTASDRVIRVFSMWEHPVPEDRLTDMVWLANRVNGMLPVGSLIVDQMRGTVGLHTSVDVTDDRLSAALLARLVGRNVDAFDELVDSLEEVRAGADGRQVMVALTTG